MSEQMYEDIARDKALICTERKYYIHKPIGTHKAICEEL